MFWNETLVWLLSLAMLSSLLNSMRWLQQPEICSDLPFTSWVSHSNKTFWKLIFILYFWTFFSYYLLFSNKQNIYPEDKASREYDLLDMCVRACLFWELPHEGMRNNWPSLPWKLQQLPDFSFIKMYYTKALLLKSLVWELWEEEDEVNF